MSRVDYPFGMDFNFAVDSVFYDQNYDNSNIPPVSGSFLLLDGSNFLLLNGTDFNLL